MTNEITKILETRDEMDHETAVETVDDVREMMTEALAEGDFTAAEEIFCDELNLEPDYILDMF